MVNETLTSFVATAKGNTTVISYTMECSCSEYINLAQSSCDKSAAIMMGGPPVGLTVIV